MKIYLRRLNGAERHVFFFLFKIHQVVFCFFFLFFLFFISTWTVEMSKRALGEL